MIMTTDFLFLFPSPTEAHDPISATVPHQGPCPEKMLPNTRPPPPPERTIPPLPGPTPYNEAVFYNWPGLPPGGPLGRPRGAKPPPPGTLRATGGDLDSCKDSESSY